MALNESIIEQEQQVSPVNQKEEKHISMEKVQEKVNANFLQTLQQGKYKFVLEFGGQGAEYWRELKTLYNKHEEVKQFVDMTASSLLEESKKDDARKSPAFETEFELQNWLQEEEPTVFERFSQAFFSYPLIAVTQIANYLVFLKSSGATHEEIINSSTCAIGHSQGVVTAVVVSSASSKEELIKISLKFIRYLFWHGLRSQESFLAAHIGKIVPGATPMLAIKGLSFEQVSKAMGVARKRNSNSELQISLINDNQRICVTGFPKSLQSLKKVLEGMCISPEEDQTRVPFSQRKPVASFSFVDLSVPFHSSMLSSAKDAIFADINSLSLVVDGTELNIPVYSTCSKVTNLQTLNKTKFLPRLVEMQLLDVVNWKAVWKQIISSSQTPTHVLDFGPDHGATRISVAFAESGGIDVVSATSKYQNISNLSFLFGRIFGLNDFFQSVIGSNGRGWQDNYCPFIIENASGKRQIQNKFTTLLKRPPIIIAGMTPTTSLNGIDLVGAAINAGFHAELAAGGLSRPNIFQDKIEELVEKIQPGRGININMLYLNAKQWGFQFPMVLRMRRNGLPIESITIAAGIPTKDRALDIIQDLQRADINLVAFKPGSVNAIYSVLEIASSAPSITVMLQWTGGRAGGHHSFEDFHQPLEETYAAIRRVPNVLLVVGSGFGDWADSVQYLTGEWTLPRGAISPMPVDAVLLGSRVMVAKEAATAKEVKELLVATPGIPVESKWEESYHKSVGGIITVTSELGEPIHKVANRCALFWKYMDDKYFSLPREEMNRAVSIDKDDIIQRLNLDFQKPYFGCKKDLQSGKEIPAELEEMNYGEVLARMIDIMFVESAVRESRWIHDSYMNRFLKFLSRSEERFVRSKNISKMPVEEAAVKANPKSVLHRFLAVYPQAITTLLSEPDVDYFVELCRSGGKPVNFIPLIDKDLKTWFKKDSLWYSEDLEAVPGRDPQRVCILQGPVAVRYSTTVNEPVADILNGVVDGYTSVLPTLQPQNKGLSTPPHIVGLNVLCENNKITVSRSTDCNMSVDDWTSVLVMLIGEREWLSAMVSSKYIVRNKRWVHNNIRDLVQLESYHKMVICSDSLSLYDTRLSDSVPVLRVISADSQTIQVHLSEFRPATTEVKSQFVTLQLNYTFHPNLSCGSIHENEIETIDAIKLFYADFWIAADDDQTAGERACSDTIYNNFKGAFAVTKTDIERYNSAISLSSAGAPMDFATVVCWKSLIRSVFAQEVRGNLLNLVHLSHSYRLLCNESTINESTFVTGDELISSCKVSSLRIIESGKIVSGTVSISKKCLVDEMHEEFVPIVELQSEFLIRGEFHDFESTFLEESDVENVVISTNEEVNVLMSKEWFSQSEGSSMLNIGDNLEFHTVTTKRFSSFKTMRSVMVKGKVFRMQSGSKEGFGTIELFRENVFECPVKTFLQSLRSFKLTEEKLFSNGGHHVLKQPIEIVVPTSALEYAVASRDLNPIHRSEYAAVLATLPEGKPIMHGMWIATKVRSLLVGILGQRIDGNVTRYNVSFDGMVYPGDLLYMQVRHTGMIEGRKILSVEVVNSGGERVVSARAEVRQQSTVFVFTGQGSAEVGMGMERYNESPVARDIWNRGDAHLRITFGFSILDIVRNNPVSLTIHFGGKKGKEIRKNYMALKCEDPETGMATALLPEITFRTQSFTFSAPEGLLFATQFSQPALVLLEKAMFSEIQEAGLIADDAMFAGHSLGEYAGLSSFAGALAVEDVAEIVFLRGLIMQKAVKRDKNGRSDYGMVAANPTRVGAHFTESRLHELVDKISSTTGKLLQVVNFNVQDRQYVVAGENTNLETLSLVMTALKLNPSMDPVVAMEDALSQAQMKNYKCVSAGKPFLLTRGQATIPLVGIDVPFHSRELLGGVPSFRYLLRTKFEPEILEGQLPLLVNRYIPNLTAQPFSMEKAYFEEVYKVTRSPLIAEVLDPMQWKLTTKAERVRLLVVELLAYQFASPVQWIKTQAHLFSTASGGVRRFVEIGPAPTLSNMALRTLQTGSFGNMQIEILCYKKDRELVHFEIEDTFPSASEYAREIAERTELSPELDEEIPESVSMDVRPVHPAPIPVSVVPSSKPAPTSSNTEDAPISPAHSLRVLIAVRLNKPLSDVGVESDVKTLTAGKSAVQNEIVGDLEKEFGGGIPDNAAEIPLKDLAAKFSGYSQLGKVTSTLISKLVAAKMPGGFSLSGVKDYLRGKGLGAGRVDSVLLHSLLSAPQSRMQNEAEARAWLDKCVDSYCGHAGFNLPSTSRDVTPGSFFTPSAALVVLPKVEDGPVTARHAIMVLLSVKLNKPICDLADSNSIKELSGGKSALQNEVVGDLEKEFGSGPDEASEMKLAELAAKFPSYNSPGKVTSALIAKLLSSKMPGGFGVAAVKNYLATQRCLPSGRIESVLLHAVTHSPKKRFSDDTQAKKWLDTVVDDYSKFAGVEIPQAGQGSRSMMDMFMMQQNAQVPLPTDFEKRLKAMVEEQIDAMNDYLGADKLDEHRRMEVETKLRENVESNLSLWQSEHGDVYESGIKGKFDPLKERSYDSYWNWAVQDALELYYRTMLAASGFSAHSAVSDDRIDELIIHFEAMGKWINEKVDALNNESATPPLEWFKPYICNRATPELLKITCHFVQKAAEEGMMEYSQAIQLLAEQVAKWLDLDPVNVQIFAPTCPHLEVRSDGSLDYSEVPRTGVQDSIAYVDELARGLEYQSVFELSDDSAGPFTAKMTSTLGLETSINDGEDSSDDESDIEDNATLSPDVEVFKSRQNEESQNFTLNPVSGPKLDALRDSLLKRDHKSSFCLKKSVAATATSLRYGLDENLKKIILPHVHIRKSSEVDPTIRLYDVEATCSLLRCMREMATSGVTFRDKVALLTGCGRNSIGAELVKSLLEGGATVFVTTSSFNQTTTSLFQTIYERHGSRGSKLVVLPFNQASKNDVEMIIQHIYGVHKTDLDFIIPFAALSEVGRTMSDLDAHSELSHRIMLTNTLRLLGEVVNAKKSRNIFTRPAHVILPFSPNHGNFGGDGLYAESKLGLESLLNKWHSEGWNDQLSIVGAVIGWTRGTGLMSGNNIVAEGVEKLGVRTFSTVEMGFNLSVLMHPELVDKACEAPLWADLTGGMAQIQNLKKEVDQIRSGVLSEAQMKAAVNSAFVSESNLQLKNEVPQDEVIPKANLSGYFCNSFPGLSRVQEISKLRSYQLLSGMVDFEKVVVVAGFGEVGPWGSARTRWEMESYGEFSMEGCIELAWLTGRILYKNGEWIDATTSEVVPDHMIKVKYEEDILAHTGIRIVEPSLFDGYDPNKKLMLHQVAIEKKMAPMEVADLEEAMQFREELGVANVDVFQNSSGAWMIRLRKGAVLHIPRALSFDRFVAGQIPTGWSAERLGLSKDLADGIDPISLYTLVSTVEALVAAGVTDPYEFYQYVHVSQVGNTSGGGMGGMRSFTRIYQNRLLGKPAPSDTLQECFINTAPAWVNMLLLSSSGPIKTPVGACATAAESVDIGVETIKSGKARIVIVGGYDDFGEEGSYEFAQMKATSDSVKETNMGRSPKEMCRPCSSTRGGFMESHGSGIQLLMDARLAFDMGCPIYAVVALTNTATDKNGRSVPAPGQGILTTARENGSKQTSKLLELEYRRRQFDCEIESIDAWYAREKDLTDPSHFALLDDMKQRRVKSAQGLWGTDFFQSRSDIAPLRGALNVWNLSIDDIGVASFHGTGTKANDKNESEVTHKQLHHLGRSSGNPLPVVCQKYLTGHPKGAAAAWMFNGLIQMLNSGLIPGNRNLDNTCTTLRQFDLLVYPNRAIQTDGIKAAIMKSFGFGQAGGEILLVHPDYLLATLSEDLFNDYIYRREKRLTSMNSYLQKSLSGKQKFIQVKAAAPYTSAEESNVYLDPTARAHYDPVLRTWRFGSSDVIQNHQSKKSSKRVRKSKVSESEVSNKMNQHNAELSPTTLEATMAQSAQALGLAASVGIGVDVEPLSTFENLHGREDFIRRNFTDQEIAYCYSAPNPAASFAGRWAAKEAVIKAISSAAPNTPNLWKGPSAPLREIEIFMTASGAPSVVLAGHALLVFNSVGLSTVSVAISHSGDYAVSQAVSKFY